MHLRDLANDEQVVDTGPSSASEVARKREPIARTSELPGPVDVRWLVVEAGPLDDEPFLVVFEKKDLRDARRTHPGKVIYFPPEIEELLRYRDVPDYLKALEVIHLVKKKFGAWIIPSDSPLPRDTSKRSALREAEPGQVPDVPKGDSQEAFTLCGSPASGSKWTSPGLPF